jgi:hypothetical protein
MPWGPPHGVTRTGYRAFVVRVVPLLVLTLLVLALLPWATRWIRAAAARRPGSRGSVRAGSYEFEPRRDQAKRRLKGVAGPAERRDEIVVFLNTHEGVEAYVEPKTVVSPKSVVLIDGAGEWRRFELKEDTYLRRISAERGVPIFDAALTGYPPRMRRRPGPTG